MIQLHHKKFDLYISHEEIETAISSMADRIKSDLEKNSPHSPPTLLPVLNGSFIFMATLCRYLQFPLNIEFVKISSYEGTKSTEKHDMSIPLKTSLKDRDVIIIEDILDTGATLAFFVEHLKRTHQPRSVKIACLFKKEQAQKHLIHVDYVGLTIKDQFVVGYGLDYDGLGRNLHGLYAAI